MAGLFTQNGQGDECSGHTHIVNLKWRSGERREGILSELFQQPLEAGIASGLLRVLGEHVDGYCVTRNATDENFTSAFGMTFHFSTRDKAEEFKNSLHVYLHPSLVSNIAVT